VIACLSNHAAWIILATVVIVTLFNLVQRLRGRHGSGCTCTRCWRQAEANARSREYEGRSW
jgi:hypothetical protein